MDINQKKLGRQTVAFACPPSIVGHANVVGKKEGEGPLAGHFDHIAQDDSFGEKSWEKAESAMQRLALSAALNKAGRNTGGLDYLFGGDLLNQCIGSSFAVRGQDVPFLGLYGACSTMAEGLCLAAMVLDGGFGQWAAALTSSHFCSAAVPGSPGVRRPAHSHRPVDGDRVGLRRSGTGGKRPLYYPCHCGKNCRHGD